MMIKTCKSIIAVMAMAIVIAVMTDPVTAADQVTLQEQEKLMAQVRQDTGMSADGVDALKTHLNTALKAAGDGGPVRSMVRISYDEGCQGHCLGVALNAFTRAMNRSYSTGEAQSMIRKEIRTCVRERAQTGMSDAEMAQRLQNRLEQRILAKGPATTESTGSKSGSHSGSGKGGPGDRK